MEILLDAPCALSHKSAFKAQFSRARNTLYLVAYRLLGDATRAHQVVDHCWTISSQRRPTFATDGARYSWLLRLAIDHALLLQSEIVASLLAQ
jgi:DNA-directed RNA polymerase specialized sigma24 family protein